VHEVVDRLRAARPEIDVLVRGEAEEVLAHETYFRRALQNLVANAKRYAKSQVIVEYERDGDGLRLCVSTTGPASKRRPAAHLRTLHPRRRQPQPRIGRRRPSLAIVARICKAHGGSVAVADHDAAGTRFVTFWPAR
jgi:signal transduction histidine kinase